MDTTMKEADIPVCDVLSCEEIAQAWWEAISIHPWRWLSPQEKRWQTDAVADLIARKVIVAGRRASSPDTSDDACCATRA